MGGFRKPRRRMRAATTVLMCLALIQLSTGDRFHDPMDEALAMSEGMIQEVPEEAAGEAEKGTKAIQQEEKFRAAFDALDHKVAKKQKAAKAATPPTSTTKAPPTMDVAVEMSANDGEKIFPYANGYD